MWDGMSSGDRGPIVWAVDLVALGCHCSATSAGKSGPRVVERKRSRHSQSHTGTESKIDTDK